SALGYVLFALLMLIGAFPIATLLRARRGIEAGVLVLAALLLGVVAATPSLNAFHEFCSLVLLGLLYSYYALLLYHWDGRWLWVHLPIPMVLVLATRAHSFGLWQKSLIVYFVLAANIHFHVLARWLPARAPVDRGAFRPGRSQRRKVVFVVEPGRG